MRKTILFIMLISSILLQAQGLDFSGGYTPNGYGASINFNHYFEPNYSYLQIGIDGSYANTNYSVYKVPYSDFTLRLGYFYPLFENHRQTFQFAGGVGFVGGYEMVNMGGTEFLPDRAQIISKSNYIFGGFLSGELNFFLSRNLFALVKYNQYYYLNTDLDPFSLYGGIGIRYYIDY